MNEIADNLESSLIILVVATNVFCDSECASCIPAKQQHFAQACASMRLRSPQNPVNNQDSFVMASRAHPISNHVITFRNLN